MIQQTYGKLEQTVDSIDERIKSQYQDLLKNFFALKYNKLANCLNAIPTYNEAAIKECTNKMSAYEVDFKTEIDNQKKLLYTCINSNYQKTEKDDLYEKNLNICFTKFDQEISKTFKNLEKKLKIK